MRRSFRIPFVLVLGGPILRIVWLGLALVALDVSRVRGAFDRILMIAVDDLGPVLSSDAHPLLMTPNLDRLLDSGVYFERAYCQIPLCNPSRASILTGMRPDRTTVYDLSRHFRSQLTDTITLPQSFKNRGWYTARVGKIYHYDVPNGIGTNGLDDPRSWLEVFNPKGRDVADQSLIFNPTPERPVSAALSWLAADGTDDEQTDGMIANQAIAMIREHAKEPFFIAAGFFRPHTPFVAPRKYFELYDPSQLKVAECIPNDRDDIPESAFAHNNRIPNYGLDVDDLRKSLHAYYASVSFLDAQIGKLLRTLDELNLTQRTVVVLWSDHGYHLGEHCGVWQKRTMFEESTRTPLIMSVPNSKGNGRACREIVELIDIYPTLLELSGASAVSSLQGKSLVAWLEDPAESRGGFAISQILRPPSESQVAVMGRSVRTDDYRYTEWNGGSQGVELYDHRTDPEEIVNIAGTLQGSALVESLKKLFEDRARSSPPPKEIFEPSRL